MSEERAEDGRATPHKCTICGDSPPLQTHHTSYYPEETLQLCASCHNKVHKTDGFHDDLEPDRSRPDGYASEGFVRDFNPTPRHVQRFARKTCEKGKHEYVTDPKADVRVCIFCELPQEALAEAGIE